MKKKRTASKDRKAAELARIYKEYRENFTAADLQRYTEEEPGIPAEKVLAEMEAIHRRVTKTK